MPIHWLSEVSSGTRAVAAEMGGPTLRTFQSYRADFEFLLREILDKELARALGIGDWHYEISFSDLEPSAKLELARSAAALVGALQDAVDRGWLSNETAQEWLLEFSGKNFDLQVEAERLERERGEEIRE